MSQPRLLIDGAPATPEDLAHQALVNYGAYTSFRVEADGVRGLDRHLARLDASAIELFGAPVGEDRLRDLIRRALGDQRDAWLRVSLFSRDISHRRPDAIGAPRVMVAVSAPPPPLAALRLQQQTHERDAPHLKHLATFGLIRARRLAQADGFDDALFVTRGRRISEGSLWNIGFLRGDRVIWPQAPMLPGVTQALLTDRLPDVGLRSDHRAVEPADLAQFDGAFVCNSATPAGAVTLIDDMSFPACEERLERLRRAWALAPAQPI